MTAPLDLSGQRPEPNVVPIPRTSDRAARSTSPEVDPFTDRWSIALAMRSVTLVTGAAASEPWGPCDDGSSAVGVRRPRCVHDVRQPQTKRRGSYLTYTAMQSLCSRVDPPETWNSV